MLDGDPVLEQGLADRGARRRLDLITQRTVLGVRQDLDDGHVGLVQMSSTLRPASALRMPRFMRAAAKASVAAARALTASSMARWSSLPTIRCVAEIWPSIAFSSVPLSRSPSAASADWVASTSR